MPKHTTTILKILGIGIALLQLFDFFIHAVTDQLEILRVTSNIIVLLWLAMAAGKFNGKFSQIAMGSVGTYLILNIMFLALEGVRNMEQGGELRVTLFLLIVLTTALSALLIYIQGRQASN
jgi:NADH:ubiquinone oxidoreductase subunit 2 (subunit N)